MRERVMEDVICVKERHQPQLLQKENVVGVGVGYKKVKGERTDTVGIVLFVEEKVPQKALKKEDIIPEEIEGVPTDVQVGVFKALSSQGKRRTEKWRPAPGGVSIGHYKGSSGTLGTLVYDRSGEKLILSCNHVLACANEGRIGDPVLQPGPCDGGRNPDEIAQLYGFTPLFFSVENNVTGAASVTARVVNTLFDMTKSPYRFVPVRTCTKENTHDAALALPARDACVDDTILGIGMVDGCSLPELGMHVEKSGRSTGHTKGVVETVETAVRVRYPGCRKAVFSHQVVVDLRSQDGDSGAVVVTEKKAVGLLFAGSESLSVCSPLSPVLNALECRI